LLSPMLYISVNAVQTVNTELDAASPCVSVWNDTAQRLLRGIRSANADESSNRLTRISERLERLQKKCATYLEQVESALDDSTLHTV